MAHAGPVMTARQAVEKFLKKRQQAQHFNILTKGSSAFPSSKVGEVFTSINARHGSHIDVAAAALKGLKSRKKRVAKLLSLSNLGYAGGEKDGKHNRKQPKARNAPGKNRLQSHTQLENYEYNVNTKSLSPDPHNRTNPTFTARKQQLVNSSLQSLQHKDRGDKGLHLMSQSLNIEEEEMETDQIKYDSDSWLAERHDAQRCHSQKTCWDDSDRLIIDAGMLDLPVWSYSQKQYSSEDNESI